MYNEFMANKIIICGVCKKEIEVRWGIFAHDTLNRHMKEHK
jgi:uncharacterized CHY-type Zn-finger protein